MNKWICLVIGSVAGGVARYAVAHALYQKIHPTFPFGTLIVNATGCLLIGLFHALAHEKMRLSADQAVLLMTGFYGAYTTFSTFILESFNLMQAGLLMSGALYVISS